MPADALAVHGLSAEFLADKPLFAAVADEFLSKSWCVDDGSDMFRACPKWRVDTLKIVLGLSNFFEMPRPPSFQT
jgi:hypothetical protein